ncbi:MAG TPA: DUF1849 family protein [Micavibrio sp.]|jgi:hypothetical protein
MIKTRTIFIGLGALIAGLLAYGSVSAPGKTATPAAMKVEDMESSSHEDLHIAPHKALYKIEMISKRSSAQVLNIAGEMYFEWKPVCDAWETTHRFNLNYEYADTAPMRITSDFITYEGYKGDTFDFNSRRRRDGEMYEELRGHAEMPGAKAAGKAAFTLPDDLEFDLPPGTLFPMAHTVNVLKAAREGKKFYTATIFDGSDDQGPAEVTAFIGKQVNALARVKAGAAIDAALINTPAWDVRLAFFPLLGGETESDYEMNAIFHDNGVISDMVVDYKDFSVTQKLVALEEIKPETCDTPIPAKPPGKAPLRP